MDFPLEVLEIILSFLSVGMILEARQVSKTWRIASMQPLKELGCFFNVTPTFFSLLPFFDNMSLTIDLSEIKSVDALTELRNTINRQNYNVINVRFFNFHNKSFEWTIIDLQRYVRTLLNKKV